MNESAKPSEEPTLSDIELDAMDKSMDLAVSLRNIIGNGPNGYYDWLEATVHIHALQNMILSQAAARSYPDKFRLLGEKLESKNDCDPA